MNHQVHANIKNQILQNLENIHNRIAKACANSGRNTDEVKLMLVTKTVPVPIIRMVLEQGESLIGENLVPELENKIEELKDEDRPHIHFIGQIKETEINPLARHVECIQSVDHYSEAFQLNEVMGEMNKKMDVLIQVNTSRRDTPYGISPAHTIGLAMQIARLENLRLKGLMTLGMFDTTPELARNCFRLLRNLFDELRFLKIPGVHMEILSMGMSDHLEIAIEEGSTMVRIGTAIFGERETPDSFYWQE